jgi:hypothetical protein
MSDFKPLYENNSYPPDQLEKRGYNAVPHHVPAPQPPADGTGSQSGNQGNVPAPQPSNEK